MEQGEGSRRFGKLQAGLSGEPAQAAARLPGDDGRWTRNRSMPLEDILRCTLFKKGLTATAVCSGGGEAGTAGKQTGLSEAAAAVEPRWVQTITHKLSAGLLLGEGSREMARV